jgi:hypothetical protein
MWRTVNIAVGACLLLATAEAAVYGATRSNDDAERLLEHAMTVLAVGFAAQVALLVALVVFTPRRYAYRRNDGDQSVLGWFFDTGGRRHAPGLRVKVQVALSLTYIWLFNAWLGAFIAMGVTIANCDC